MNQSTKQPAIFIKDLQKTYKPKKGEPVEALKGVSFSVEQGAFFGLLGPNGAGKSTLINIIAGVSEKTGGQVVVNSIDLDRDPIGVKEVIGVVPQEISFDPFLTVEQALRYHFGYYDQEVDETHLAEVVRHLSLTDKLTVKPRALSGGMKRRFMIAKALMHRPKVLFLDEPTAGVDIALRQDLYALAKEINQMGTTIVLTSHYLEEVELLCEQVAVIHNGLLAAIGHKEELKEGYASLEEMFLAVTSK